jgi:hypothetical protein
LLATDSKAIDVLASLQISDAKAFSLSGQQKSTVFLPICTGLSRRTSRMMLANLRSKIRNSVWVPHFPPA